MTLHLYNTLTRRKEPFEPIDAANVRMYVCGPTVYDFAHIGNARPVVVFDVLYRLLRHTYGADHVTYVRNITDVDDKIIAAAKETGEDISAITERFTAAFHADMAALGALPPDVEPRATAHIPEMIALVETLIANGHAYAADGHVLFSIASMADYGKLSRHSREELIDGDRVEIAPYKKDPADFVLWKPSVDDQPGWDSPWGFGRPGWHLECSAMSEKHLGVPFDIHGGGRDLIFPHHENEIAQSRSAHGGAEFARYWMHNGYLTVEGEKMSKSLGNFFTVRQLLKDGWDGEIIRWALLKSHYRQPLDFTISALNQAAAELDGFYTSLSVYQDLQPDADEVPLEVQTWLEEDLNISSAIRCMHDIRSDLNNNWGDLFELKEKLLAAGKIFGVLQEDPEKWRKRSTRPRQPRETHNETVGSKMDALIGPNDADVEQLITERKAARGQKDFDRADEIRKQLEQNGVLLEDRPDGSTDWRRV